MQIFVKTPAGRTVAVTVSSADTVSSIAAQAGVEGDVFFAGAALDMTATVAECALQKESTLTVMVPVEGGKGKKKKKRVFTKPKKPLHKHRLETMRALKYFKVTEDDDGNTRVEVARTECTNPKCGAGVFLARHKDREYCGKCHATFKQAA